jgi:hypothetical protein
VRNIDELLQKMQEDQAVRQEGLKSGRIRVERPEKAESHVQDKQKKAHAA